MHYNVPQFIDIEDTIVGPLTAKQLLWLFVLAAALLVMWFSINDSVIFLILALPVVLLFMALAFYKPQGQSFIKFLSNAALFLVRPKIYIWKRDGNDARRDLSKKKMKENTLNRATGKKDIKREEIAELAKILDSEGDIINDKF